MVSRPQDEPGDGTVELPKSPDGPQGTGNVLDRLPSDSRVDGRGRRDPPGGGGSDQFQGNGGREPAVQHRHCSGRLQKETAGISQRTAPGDGVRSGAGAAGSARTARGQTPAQALPVAQQTSSPIQGDCPSQSLLEKQ